MAFCTVENVRTLVDTDMEDAEISDLIDETDAFIAVEIAVAATHAHILRAISRTWTAFRVMVKDPASERVGEWSTNRAENMNLLKDEYMHMIDIVSGVAGGIVFRMTSSPIEG